MAATNAIRGAVDVPDREAHYDLTRVEERSLISHVNVSKIIPNGE